MSQIINRLHANMWRAYQRPWGPPNGDITQIKWGTVEVTVKLDDIGERVIIIHHGGSSIEWVYEGGHLFDDADLPDGWGNHEFIDWADNVLRELE
jgi:hypothetical protein